MEFVRFDRSYVQNFKTYQETYKCSNMCDYSCLKQEIR